MKMIRFSILFFVTIMIGCGKKFVPIDDVNSIDNLIDVFQNQDTVWVRSTIDLKGRTITINKKTLIFEGNGKLINGTLVGLQAKHVSDLKSCYENVKIEGTWKVKSSYLEWFGASPTSPSGANFKALSNAIVMGDEVNLKAIYPIAMNEAKVGVNISKAVIIRGDSKDKTGLILETKSTVFFPYFARPEGSDLILENMTLVTRDYFNGIRTNSEADYYFMGSYYNDYFNPNCKPKVNYVEISSCIIKGAVSIVAYGAHSDNQSFEEFKKANHVKKVSVENNLFEFCNSPFGFSNVGYDSIHVSNNIVKNMSSTFLGAPISGISPETYLYVSNHRGSVSLTDNVFENDRVINTPKERAMSPCVIKGGRGVLLLQNNIFKNLLNGATDSDTYTYYYTCSGGGKAIIINNTFTNVLARSSSTLPSCLIKERGSNDLLIEHNTFEIYPEALVKLGLLSSENQSLSVLDRKEFYFSFMQNGSVSQLLKKYTIKNNIFRMPYVNMSSEISEVRDFLFENNTLEISYYGQSQLSTSTSRDNVFFMGYKRLDPEDGASIGDFMFMHNKVMIGASTSSTIDFINYIDGVQNGFVGSKDMKPNFGKVIFKDNVMAKGITLGYTLLDGNSHEFEIDFEGKGNQFSLMNPTGSNHLRPNTTRLNTQISLKKVDDGSIKSTPFVVVPNSKQRITIEETNIDQVYLMSYNYLTSLFNNAGHLPLLLRFEFKGKNRQNQEVSETYNLIIESKYQSFCHLNSQGVLESYSPSEPESNARRFNSRSASSIKLNVAHASQRFGNAWIYLTGCAGFKDLQIEFTCESINISKDNIQSIEPILKQLDENSKY